jgi:hypothetical protein
MSDTAMTEVETLNAIFDLHRAFEQINKCWDKIDRQCLAGATQSAAGVMVEPNGIGDLANEIGELVRIGEMGAARLVWGEVQMRVETLLKQEQSE